MRTTLALLLGLLVTGASGAALPLGGGYGAIDAMRDVDPVSLARRFCEARVSGVGMEQIAPYFAPKLARLLGDRPAPDIPWQSVPDRPSACTVEVVNGYTDTIGVLVRVTYTTAERSWSDTLNFERTRDSWRLNNVFYDGGGNLRFRLFGQRG